MSRLRRFRRSLPGDQTTWLALLGYAALTAVMTWPVVARLSTHVPGGTVDLWTHRWTYWWIKHAIAEGHDLLNTHLLFFPQGVSLIFHNIAWVNIALWLPLQSLVGGNAAYSLTFLIFSTLNGFAMYLLAREWVDSLPAAFVGGLVYAFWPYAMSQFGHPNMKVTCWVPLVLLYLRRTLDEQRVNDALLTGLFLALVGLTRWQLLFMAAVLFALYLAWRLAREKALWNRRIVGLLLVAGLLAGVLMAPLGVPVARAFLARDDPSDVLFTEEASGQTDLLAYVLPTPYHPLWNEGVARLYENFTHNKVYVPFLGYTVLIVGFYGVVTRWKTARLWLLAGAAYIALALGPQLRVNGKLHPGVPMPYRLVGDLFFIRAVRVPNRFNLFLALPVALLVSLGVSALVRRRSRKLSVVLVGILAALILLEYSLVPYHTERPVTPDWYDRLSEEPGEFAVLDLPVGLQTYNKRYMFYQIKHQKPLVEGKIARPPREAFAFVESSPFLKQLHDENTMDPAMVNVTSELDTLADANVRYVVLHKEFASAAQLLNWRDWLTFAPMHEDEDLVVYRTDPQWGRDFTFAHPLSEDVGLIRATVAATETIQGAALRIDARWGSVGVPEADYDVCLRLASPAGRATEPHCTPLSPQWSSSQWKADEVVRGSYVLSVPLSLEPRRYSLVANLADASDGALVGRAVDMGQIQVTSLQPMHLTQSAFGDRIRLRGYDLQQSADTVSLTLYWQTLREMSRSYKVFLHLRDPASGDVVAQTDAVPRRWSYPTNRWVKGEVVRDTIELSLEGVAPDQYSLMLGWYDPVTGERLPAQHTGGDRYPMDSMPVTPVRIE